jgi:hypothetical protein
MLTVAAIAGLTVFVFAAAKSTRDDGPRLPASNPPPAKTAQKPVAELVASGVRGGAYLAVYRSSRTGKPIYQGTLEQGATPLTFVGKHLWLDVARPANLRLQLNGRSVAVPGTGTGSRRWLEVTPKRVLLAPPVS